MNAELKNALTHCETDIDEVLNRLSGDEELYMRCLGLFLRDSTISELESALRAQAWDEAFTAAHALKGLAGNMGFVPLFHATAELVILIRTGRVEELRSSYLKLRRSYDVLYEAIRPYCGSAAVNDIGGTI